MLDKQISVFLEDLRKNNSKDWFDTQRNVYESARQSFFTFTEEIISGIREFDPEIGAQKASSCVFRINRDVRFSKDKSPYKTNFAFSITKGGKKSGYAGYYFHLEAESGFAGGGMYAPMPDVLQSIRREIYFRTDQFENILKQPAFKKTFKGLDTIEKLKNPPKGYDKDSPGIEYLLHKHYVVTVSFNHSDIFTPGFKSELLRVFKVQKPFIDFLNEAFSNRNEE